MKINEIKQDLKQATSKNLNFEMMLKSLANSKKKAVKRGFEEKAKEIWIYEQIITIHKNFTQAFGLLKTKNYYDAWMLLERIEIDLGSLKRHFSFDGGTYKLKFIERIVYNIQVLFPYRLFASSEIVAKKKVCSICKQTISIRNPCGHIVGEIYKGEMCVREIHEADFLGVALVENPVNKYSVMFLSNEESNTRNDHYNYESVDYLMSLIENPYESWQLQIRQFHVPHTDYPELKEDDGCPCASGDSYKNCCRNGPGIIAYDYHFVLSKKTAKRLEREGKITIENRIDFE